MKLPNFTRPPELYGAGGHNTKIFVFFFFKTYAPF